MDICRYCKNRFNKKYTTQKFCSLQCANRYNLNGLNKVILPQKSKDLAEFIGIMLGDGSVSKYFSRISLNSIADRNYVDYVTALAKKLFGKRAVTIIHEKKIKMINVQISSIVVARFLKNMGLISYGKTIPSWILNSKVYRKACLKGLFDTEGSISFKTYSARKGISVYKQLNFRSADVKLMKFVRDSLNDLGFSPTNTPKRSLYLSTHRGIDRYRKIIGFGNKKLLRRSLVKDLHSYRKWRGDRVGRWYRS